MTAPTNHSLCRWATDRTPVCRSTGVVMCRVKNADIVEARRFGTQLFCKPHARAACFGPFPKKHPRVWEIIGGEWP